MRKVLLLTLILFNFLFVINYEKVEAESKKVESTFLSLDSSDEIVTKSKFTSYASNLGFNIGENYTPISIDGTYIRKVYNEAYSKDKLEHKTAIYDLLVYNRDNPSIMIYAYKIITKPYQPGRNWGFMGIGSYGDDFLQDKIHIKSNIPDALELLNYAPKNKPQSTTDTIGVSLGTDSVGIEASVSYNHSELVVMSKSSVLDNLYDVTYDFDSSKWTTYVTNEVETFGMFIFDQKAITTLEIEYNISYHDWNNGESGLESFTKLLSIGL